MLTSRATRLLGMWVGLLGVGHAAGAGPGEPVEVGGVRLRVLVLDADEEVVLEDEGGHEQRRIDAPAAAGARAAVEGGGDAVGEQGRAHEVGDGRALGDGAAVAHAAVHGHEAAVRLDDLVHPREPGVRPLLPEGGDVPHDDAGVALGEAVVIEAELLRRGRGGGSSGPRPSWRAGHRGCRRPSRGGGRGAGSGCRGCGRGSGG